MRRLRITRLALALTVLAGALLPAAPTVAADPVQTLLRLLAGGLDASPDQPLVLADDPHGMPLNLLPALPAAPDLRSDQYRPGCHSIRPREQAHACTFGATSASFTVLILGDSHGAMWLPAFQAIAAQRHWRIRTLTKSACPPPRISVDYYGKPYPQCDAWRDDALRLVQHMRPQLVVATSSTVYELTDGQRLYSAAYLRAWSDAWVDTLRALGRAADHVVLLGDVPQWSKDPIQCVATHPDDVRSCSTPRQEAFRADMTRANRRAARKAGATYVDPSRLVCPGPVCEMVQGRYLVAYDDSHLTPPYARSLGARLEALLPAQDIAGAP